jgi:methylaspartate mutase epsilon subunit
MLWARYAPEVSETPTFAESDLYMRQLAKPSVVDVLREARRADRVALQPRCGTGGHAQMIQTLTQIEREASPEILTVTIDSYTRLNDFSGAQCALNSNPEELNGYPLVAHGWRRGRELNDAVRAPIEVRHGSPDPRRLFHVSIASGFSSFEGGGITYNLPYCKDVPLADSLAAWWEIDCVCGELQRRGTTIDRELFGTLTAVLVPPSISLALTILEAVLAAKAGVRCISISYPQGGNTTQDIAALRSIEPLAAHYLPPEVEVYPVLHEFMGVFPRQRERADELILYGALIARLGKASKLITKTNQEALGIPDAFANAQGILTSRLAQSRLLDCLAVDEAGIEEEADWIHREVQELLAPLLQAEDLRGAIVEAFAAGTLDVPFSASIHARSDVIPKRDPSGAIRYLHHGALPFSARTLARNRQQLGREGSSHLPLFDSLRRDIQYFELERGT